MKDDYLRTLFGGMRARWKYLGVKVKKVMGVQVSLIHKPD